MANEITIPLTEETVPPRDPSHGTPHAMLRRALDIEVAGARSSWEQTDYGHPGRLNPWEPRHIDARLQPKTERLRAVAEAVGGLLQ
jgi:hypothetical protein